jgi:hypothetical protein
MSLELALEAREYDPSLVFSSHGVFNIDQNGFVLTYVQDGPDTEDTRHMHTVRRFNLEEHRRKYKKTDVEFDILDLGYWYREAPDEGDKYAQPAHDWRKDRMEEAANG